MYKTRLDPLYISVNFPVYLLNRIIYCTCKYILLFSPLIFQPFTSRHSQQPILKQLLYTRISISYKLFSPNHMKKILALAYWWLNRYNLQFWLSPILNLLTTIRVCEFPAYSTHVTDKTEALVNQIDFCILGKVVLSVWCGTYSSWGNWMKFIDEKRKKRNKKL